MIRPRTALAHVFSSALFLRGGLLCGILAGCGGGSPAPAPAPVAVPAQPAGTTSPAAAAPTASPSAAPVVAIDASHKETKWIGKIPYDVFYDQPLNIATDTTSLGGPAPTATIAAATAVAPAMPNPGSAPPAADSPPASAADSAAPAGGNINWGEVLPMPMLVEEMKILRTRLTGNLQTVATFNKSQNPIALDGAMLAALAAVAAAHPEETSWKPNAHFVRDLAAEINANSSGTGREPYTKTKEPFDKAMVILDGGKPPEMDSPETKPLAESVYVADMMKRIELTFNNLKANINTDARLKEDPAAAEREMRIMMTLAKMMTDSSYDSADEPQYQAFLKRFLDGTTAGVQAIQTGSLDGFQAAMNQIQTTCAECHQQYRGSDSGF